MPLCIKAVTMRWGWQQLGGLLEHSKLEVLLAMPVWLGADALSLRRATSPPKQHLGSSHMFCEK